MIQTKYKGGKIYRVKSKNTEKTYIGSTTANLHERHKQHIYEYKRCCRENRKESTIIEVMKHGDYSIELLELFPCKTKNELLNREGYWQKKEPNCVNKMLASVGGRKDERFKCECGSDVRWYGRTQHFATKKHNRWVKQSTK